VSGATEFLTLLEPKEDELQRLKARYYVLAAFNDELARVTRGRRFWIRNEPVWTIVLDSRDMLVIHLASWCKSVYEPGGLLRKVQGAFSSLLRPNRRTSAARRSKQGDPHLEAWRDDFHLEAFKRLFPSADSHGASAADVDALKDRFCKHVKPVLRDRSDNRAHAFEPKPAEGNVKMLNFRRVARRFRDLRRAAERPAHRRRRRQARLR
jgi:hypothetical protein